MAGTSTGTGWRIAAWAAFAVGSALTFYVQSAESRDTVQAAIIVGGILLAMLDAVLGLVFSVLSVADADAVPARRVDVILPFVANAGLLLFVVGRVFAA
jgi:hypothetical protein